MFPALCVVAVAMARVVSDVKAADIKVLFVKPLVYWTHFFIIATAFSRPQIDAIGYIHFDFWYSYLDLEILCFHSVFVQYLEWHLLLQFAI